MKASTDRIEFSTGVSRKRIWTTLRNVAHILVPRYYDNVESIGASGAIVEIDESKFGKRKYNRGHHVDGVWILGAVEKTEPKRIILVVVDDRKKEPLENKLKAYIKEDSVVYTDGWRAYNNLSAHFEDHGVVNHSENFKDPVTGVHTNTIEGSWAGVKLHVPFRGRTKDKVSLYLVRYMLIKNDTGHPLARLLNYLF